MEARQSVAIHGARVRQLARTDDSLEDFIFDTVSAALRDWNVTVRDLDNVIMASSDQLDGRSISAMVTGASVGGYRRDLINLSSASEHAAYALAARIAAGRSRLGLAVSWGKPSEAPLPAVDRLTAEPFFTRGVALERRGALGLEATAIRARSGFGEGAARAVAAKNRRNAEANPRAVAASRNLDEALEGQHPSADACVAILMGVADAADRSGQVRITGRGAATGTVWGDSRINPAEVLRIAATRAYARAGVTDPAREIDFAEITDITPWHELMAHEALRLSGDASAAALSGGTGRDGAIPINPSGGIAAGDADFPAGLTRLAEAALQMLGQAGAVSLARRGRAVVQGSPRTTSQLQTVFVLEHTP